MAEMTSGQRAACANQLMTDLSRLRVPIGALTKADVRAAVDAADAWAEANAPAYNAALPQPARGVLTAGLKSQLLAAVILARYQNGA